MKDIKIAILTFSFILHSSLYSEDFQNYQVKPGDQIGKILFEREISPLWGPKGNVEKVMKINGLENPLLEIGQVIQIPIQTEQRGPASLTGNENVEVASKQEEEKNLKDDTISIIERGHRKSEFGIFPELFFTKVNLVDPQDNTKATLLSNANISVDLFWKQYWSESFRSELFYNFAHVSFEKLPNRTLSKNKENLSSIGVSFHYQWTEIFNTELELHYGEELYISAPNTSSIGLDKAAVPSARVNLELKAVSINPFDLSIQAGARTIFSTKVGNYNSEQGYGYQGGLKLTHKKKESSVTGIINYEIIDKDTNNLKQSHNNLYFSIGYSWDF